MCTQVGVGALIVSYAVIGAFMFVEIESYSENENIKAANINRNVTASNLWDKIEQLNMLNNTLWWIEVESLMKAHQLNFTMLVRSGYQEREPKDIWKFPPALMFCLSVFSMIGYGNLVPRTDWGKVMTMVSSINLLSFVFKI
jgi:potassium channel subfamily K, invertebrate